MASDAEEIEIGEEEVEEEEAQVDGDEDGEEEEEEEEGEGDESYNLKFYGEMDPLDFALNDSTNGDDEEIYQQFQRLEYEALAEKKRKALSHPQSSEGQVKKARNSEILGVTMEEMNEFNELMNFGRRRRRSKAGRRRGRRKRTKNNHSPEVARKIGDATLQYACGNYSEAIPLLEEIIRLAPCSPDAYYMLGLIYDANGDRKKAMNFHMIAAHLTPKDPSIWKKLVAWSMEQKNTGQVRYCLSKAITADPKDVGTRFDLAHLYFDLGEYVKAAGLYSQIVGLYPGNITARNMAAKMYQKCGQLDKAVSILEDFVNDHSSDADKSVIDLLITLLMENNEHSKALEQIDRACFAYSSGNKVPLYLKAKAVLCHAHLGNLEHTEGFLKYMQTERAEDECNLITEVGDTFADLGHFDYALKFYFMLEGVSGHDTANLHRKIANCYVSIKDGEKAISFFYRALSADEDSIDSRITLSSLLLAEGKEDEAIILLSAPKSPETVPGEDNMQPKPWWLSGKVRMHLAKIYLSKGMLEDFVNAIYSLIHQTLIIEAMNHKVRSWTKMKSGVTNKKRLTKSVLHERAKLLDDGNTDNVFHKFKPLATTSDLLKASRAKKALEKQAAAREEKKAAAIAAGMDWQSEDSEDEPPLARRIEEPPLPGLLTGNENHQLILELCKALLSLRRYLESLEIINLTLKFADKTLLVERKEELQSLGAQIAYNTRDTKHAYEYARYVVQKDPDSISAWNCYYSVVSRLEVSLGKHKKFMHRKRVELEECVPPIIISGHQFTNISQHQAAAREYLEAYKVQPENPLINLCVGTALISLTLGFRLKNKHRCIVQGFAFLYKYMRLCNNSQEALYNVARAYHHVGLVTLAASYYERVLRIQEKDYPFPKLPNEAPTLPENHKPGYCNLHSEAAYNLHLIYKKSGAVDLARQVLKNYCTP